MGGVPLGMTRIGSEYLEPRFSDHLRFREEPDKDDDADIDEVRDDNDEDDDGNNEGYSE